jgi:endonuclease/exonuclease/phosphatase family metal-dependent hydrolase
MGGNAMMIRVRVLLTITAVSMMLILPAVMAMAQPINLAVMTQNLYLGADTTPILTAKTLPEFQAAIIAARDSIVANNFLLRAEAIASEVATAGGPLLIGLQESEIVSESDVPQSLNYADTLIAALKGHGLNYTYRIPGLEDAVHTGFVLDSGTASILNPRFTLTDQEVVLVRSDVANFTVKSISARTFANDVTVSTLIGQFSLKRGYVLVDASLDGVPFQFVSTHLAETHDLSEPAEVGEILTALGTTNERQIVVGDFNARPDEVCGGSPCGPKEMLAAGFVDTGRGLGPTCCQSPTLENPVSSLNNRYDYMFERGFRAIHSAALVGDQPFEGKRPLWPSDHAGVVATIAKGAGTPGFSNCFGVSISTLSHQFRNDLDGAAKALGFSNVQALRNAVRAFCRS